MKKIALLAALGLLLLHACSSSETAPETAPLPHPDDAAAASSTAEPSLSSDPFLAPESTAATTESNAADSLLATPVENSSTPPAESLASPTPSEPAPTPTEPVPEPTLSVGHEVPATPVMPAVKADPRKRDSYEEYKAYREKEEIRKDQQDAYDDRSLFPHEDGGWHLSLDYMRNAYPNSAINSLTSPINGTSQGGQIAVMYFPLRSLSYGRLGAGVTGGMHWTKYEYPSSTIAAKTDRSSARSMYTYGGRLMYEFDYWLGQLVVPFVSFDFTKVRLSQFERRGSNVLVPARAFDSQCYGVGGSLNLNRLEPVSASRGLAGLGIRKTYLSYTFLKPSSGSTGSSTHALGLRFEY